MRHPHVLQLIMDSLRYWVLDMHVDGFRFDLASSLARQFHEVDRLSAFFDLVQQDPVVSQVKLIAEPWDVGDGGYQVGNFPPLWTEWNGKYRDTVRDYWRGEPGTVGDFASRLSGSSDLYEHSGRKPIASVNFVTAHDGFTIRDLVSYNEKHNDANGEGNNDGESHNRSWNSGVEGPTDDPEVQALRARQQRNFLVTLLLSQGVPMILHGDELGRSQQGNNNVYAQDNELSWMNWELEDWQEALLAFTKRVVKLRNEHPVFRRRRFFAGEVTRAGDAVADIAWFSPSGEHMTDADWSDGDAKALMVFLNGDGIPEPGRRGEPVFDDSFVIAFNASEKNLKFTIPDEVYGEGWVVVLDTHDDEAGSVSFFDDAVPFLPGPRVRGRVPVHGRAAQTPQRLTFPAVSYARGMSAYAWSPSDIPSLAGTTAVVTGANSGIGWHTAAELARHGADVTLAVRNLEKGEAAAARMREGAAGTLRVARLDLGSLTSVQEFAEAWDGPLGLLVNNAGLMTPPRYRQTEDGHELQFGTNHLGHFALTGRLLPALLAAPESRVVTVSSIAHHQGRADVVEGNPADRYRPTPAYGNSKLANLLFAFELQRRASLAGVALTSTAAHPGVASTGLVTSEQGLGVDPGRQAGRAAVPEAGLPVARGRRRCRRCTPPPTPLPAPTPAPSRCASPAASPAPPGPAGWPATSRSPRSSGRSART